MRYTIPSIIVFSFFTISMNRGQNPAVERGLQAITEQTIKAQMSFLSSDWMEGREAGEKGEFLAADYIASMLESYGIKPAGDYLSGKGSGNSSDKIRRSYFQNFILLKTTPGEEQVLKIKSSNDKMVKSVNLTCNVDFTCNIPDHSEEIEAPVVFAGYGYIDDNIRYSDFKTLDVKGKCILKISGFPKFVNDTLRKEKEASLRSGMETRYKSMGIIGIIEFEPAVTVVGRPDKKDFMNMSPAEGAVQRGRPRFHYSIPGLKMSENPVKIEVSARAAGEILNGTGIDLDDYMGKADRNEENTIPDLKNKSIYFRTTVKTSQVAVRNILGIVEGKNPEKVIVLGAHYDHIGMGNGYIWNGADDNGSGTVGVMTIAKALTATGEKPEHSLIIALWTAEEEGLLGSRYFIRHPVVPITSLKLNMNFDMISRYMADDEPRKVTMTYTNTFPRFRDITEINLKKYRIDLLVDFQPSNDPPGGTDHRSFVEAGIPVIRIKPGHRAEYHTPFDDTETINLDIMEKIIKIGFADTWELANSTW
jgi:hypothetical protein